MTAMTAREKAIEKAAEAMMNLHRLRNGFAEAQLSELTSEHHSEWIEDVHAALAAFESHAEPVAEVRQMNWGTPAERYDVKWLIPIKRIRGMIITKLYAHPAPEASALALLVEARSGITAAIFALKKWDNRPSLIDIILKRLDETKDRIDAAQAGKPAEAGE